MEVNEAYKELTTKKYEADNIALTEEKLRTLEKATFKNPTKEKYRDLFLIGCYSGQRWSDYSVFEKSDIRAEMIVKRAEKTDDIAYIPLHKKLRALLDKYDWKLPNISQQKFNDNIKLICKDLGFTNKFKKFYKRGSETKAIKLERWELVRSHTARRTFITRSSQRGMTDIDIMAIAGIKDPKTLHKYKKLNKDELRENTFKIWE